MVKKYNVTPFEGVTKAKPEENLRKSTLAWFRRQILGDMGRSPLNEFKNKVFKILGTCPDNGVKIEFNGGHVWVPANLLQPEQ